MTWGERREVSIFMAGASKKNSPQKILSTTFFGVQNLYLKPFFYPNFCLSVCLPKASYPLVRSTQYFYYGFAWTHLKVPNEVMSIGGHLGFSLLFQSDRPTISNTGSHGPILKIPRKSCTSAAIGGFTDCVAFSCERRFTDCVAFNCERRFIDRVAFNCERRLIDRVAIYRSRGFQL